jgi:hypothetical protein
MFAVAGDGLFRLLEKFLPWDFVKSPMKPGRRCGDRDARACWTRGRKSGASPSVVPSTATCGVGGLHSFSTS